MNTIEALILGIIQGITEFLPISSSGHLELGKALFGLQTQGEESLFLTLALHVGTALSTLYVFRTDITNLFKGIFSLQKNQEQLFAAQLLVSTIPAVLVGLFLEAQIAVLFDQNLVLVGAMLLITAVLLFVAEKVPVGTGSISFPKAILIGLIQAIAILPGISRSGSTIAGGLLLGIDRKRAARFSFLMVLPLIFGSMAKSILDHGGTPQQLDLIPLIMGFIASFFTGILACKWMLALVQKSQLVYFSLYCFIVGGISLVYGFL